MMAMLSIIATLVTTSLLILLGWRDPKRLRTLTKESGSRRQPFASNTRRLLTCAALVPGVLLALYGAWQPFLIWLGATCSIAWLAVQVLSTCTELSADR